MQPNGAKPRSIARIELSQRDAEIMVCSPESAIATLELWRRATRTRDVQAEAVALRRLAHAMAERPDTFKLGTELALAPVRGAAWAAS